MEYNYGKEKHTTFLDFANPILYALHYNVVYIFQARFDIDPRCRKWVLTDIAGKWRGWKAALKRNYYKKHDADEERLAACDERVEPEQWKAIIAFWNSEAAEVSVS